MVMDESAWVHGLRHLAWEVPILVLAGTGLVASMAYRRRFPRPSVLTCVATGLFLLTSVCSTFVTAFLVQPSVAQHVESGMGNWLVVVIGMLGYLLRGLAIGLLVMAAFTGRLQAEPSIPKEDSKVHPKRLLRFVVVSGALVVYLISLCLPAVYVSAPAIDGYGVYRGAECLIELPIALMYPAWWANPVFGVGLILVLFGYSIAGGICGLVSLLFSLSYCLHVVQDFEFNNEPLRIGYWFWVGAMFALALALLLPLIRARPTVAHETIGE
jgi:hypothetical protein